MPPKPTAIHEIAQRIGYGERTPQRLAQALTHKSYSHELKGQLPHNERLEFLGDAVLSLVISQALMAAHPEASEGTLSRLRAGLVNTRSLAEMAEGLGFGEALRLGKGEAQNGGRRKRSLLADSFEAVLGAIYLDLGMAAAEGFVLERFAPLLAREDLRPADRDHKTRLQELSQQVLGCAPQYSLLDSFGPDHEKTFEVAVSLSGQHIARAQGQAKKSAEQEAARVALTLLSDPERLKALCEGVAAAAAAEEPG